MRQLVPALFMALLASQDAPGASWAEAVRARLAQKNYLQAAEILEKELARNSGDYEMRNLLAATLERAGKIGQAARHYLRALELRPDSTTIRLNLALNHVRQGQYDRAAAQFTRILKEYALQPAREPTYQQGPDEGVMARFVSNVPAKENDWFELGMLFLRHGRLQGAQAIFRESARLAPNSARLHYGLGWALQEGGSFQQARAALHRALQLQPGFAEAALRLGYSFYTEGEYPEAVRVYEGLAQGHPSSYEAHYFLALALARSSPPAHTRALHHLRRALDIHPRSFDSRFELGRIYFETGLLAPARAELEQAVLLNPDHERARYLLGQVYLRSGESTLGQKELQASEQLRVENRNQARANIFSELLRPKAGDLQDLGSQVRDFFESYKAALLAGDFTRLWKWLTPGSRQLYGDDPGEFNRIAARVYTLPEVRDQVRQGKLRGGKLVAGRVFCEFEAESGPILPPLVLIREGGEWRIDYAFDWTTAGLGYLGAR